MPASSLFATDLERPIPTPSSANPSGGGVDDQTALQLALELSLLGLNNVASDSNNTVRASDSEAFVHNHLDAERANKRSQNMTECVAVPSSEHVAEIVGRQGVFGALFYID